MVTAARHLPHGPREYHVGQGSAKHHGLTLVPQPSGDDRDPLRWPYHIKILALAATAIFNFTANFAGAGLSVAVPVLEAQYGKLPNEVNSVLTFNFLLLGVGNLFWVPLGVKYGKRGSLLAAILLLLAALIWTALVSDFPQLLAARCLSGFAASAGESIVPAIVADIFFLHERASKMSWYTVLVSGATAIGPLCAAFIVQYSPGNWVDYLWVCVALAAFNFVLIFLFYPESNFERPEEDTATSQASNTWELPHQHGDLPEGERKCSSEHAEGIQVAQPSDTVNVVPKSWLSIWRTVYTVNPSVNLLQAFTRPLLMLLQPPVLLAIFIYGTSLASQIILIFAFPSLLSAPPYLFTSSGVGLMQIAALIGFVLACFIGGYGADIITARVIRRQKGLVYPEQRLIALAPAGFIAPVGCILVAFACGNNLHWAVIAVGFGMVSFGTVYAPNIAITYVVESYPHFAAESLVVINVFKNLVAFLFLYEAVVWVDSSGWVQVYMIMFMLVTLGMLLAIIFYFFGKKMRQTCERLQYLF